jgi:bifunctional non-homologous end joining protein LigD
MSAPRVQDAPRCAAETEAAQPTITPLRASRRPTPFDHPDWLFEPKYDGHRALLDMTPASCVFRSCTESGSPRLESLLARVRGQLNARDVVLDGVIVALDRYGRPSRRELMQGSDALAYAVFDVLRVNGRDVTALPLTRRKRLLDLTVPANTAHLMKVLTIEGDGVALYKAAARMDLAGVLARRKDDAYDARAEWIEILNPAYSARRGV